MAVAILTTASRHMKPRGDGAYTRSFYIHDRLWSYLRGMIERVFWGQERFDTTHGGNRPGCIDIIPPTKFNLPSSSSSSSSSSSCSSKGSLRSLGTVEAMLVLTDWHPRNLHFPPGDDENTLLDLDVYSHRPGLAMDCDPVEHNGTSNGGEPAGGRTYGFHTAESQGRLAFEKWLEPAWRSDRMSWMLLSIAQALAFELGVFDQKNESQTARESPSERTRKRRLRRLILVYVTQSSGRLGIPSMLPLPQWGLDAQQDHGLMGQAAESNGDKTEATVDRMLDCWIGISKLMYQSNHLLFASMEQTSELIRSGRYREQIDRFEPYLKEFRQNLDRINRESYTCTFLFVLFLANFLKSPLRCGIHY